MPPCAICYAHIHEPHRDWCLDVKTKMKRLLEAAYLMGYRDGSNTREMQPAHVTSWV